MRATSGPQVVCCAWFRQYMITSEVYFISVFMKIALILNVNNVLLYRSVYIGNVDYGATAEELEQHFHGCGSINRVTILCNKFDGTPKGFAYIEFVDKDSVETAMALDDSLFRGRQIKVGTMDINIQIRCTFSQLVNLVLV